MPLFSRKKLEKMRPSTPSNLKDLRIKVVQGGKGTKGRLCCISQSPGKIPETYRLYHYIEQPQGPPLMFYHYSFALVSVTLL